METPIEEYEQFVRARTPALLRTAYLLTGDQHLAEDLVQEALARTHRAWPRLRDRANLEAYTRKVMYHAQVARWRRRRVAEAMPGDLPEVAGRGPADASMASLASLRLTLGRAMLGLSPRQRACVVLRYFEDRSEAEAAELLGVAVGTVKSQTARALERLRVLIPELRTPARAWDLPTPALASRTPASVGARR